MEPTAVRRRQATTGSPQVIGGLSLNLCRAMVEHFEACGPIELTHTAIDDWQTGVCGKPPQLSH